MRRAALVVAHLLGGVALAGCGSPVVVTGTPVVDPYAGPMHVAQGPADRLGARWGAAGLALECDGEGYRGGRGDYQDGLESAQGDAVNALEGWLVQEGWQLPGSGYRNERDTGERVLWSYDVRGRTKIAMIAADGIRDFDGDVGWGIESWAECDPAELPVAVTDSLGIGVWQDASGRRLPVTEVVSVQGPEHCGWDDITFLTVTESGAPDGHRHHGRADASGDAARTSRNATQYVRDVNHELSDHLHTAFDAHSSLPKGAVDTGFQRDGRQLWLVPGDAAYLVRLGTPRDVEKWPAATTPILCA